MENTKEIRHKYMFQDRLIYEWEQSLDEINIYIKLPPNVLKKNQKELEAQGLQLQKITVKIQKSNLVVGIIGLPPYLNEKTGGDVNVADSLWTIEDDELHVLLSKLKKGDLWPCACEGHQKLDPLAQNEDKKKLLLERFGTENPGFDFSGADVNGMVPDAKTFMGGMKYC